MAVNRNLLIGGEEVPAADGRATADLNPHTGHVLAEVASAGPADVTRAVDAAHAAFPGWSATSPRSAGAPCPAPRTCSRTAPPTPRR